MNPYQEAQAQEEDFRAINQELLAPVVSSGSEQKYFIWSKKSL